MTEATIEKVYEELKSLKKDVAEIKEYMHEDFELSKHAKKELKEARETPESDYVDL